MKVRKKIVVFEAEQWFLGKKVEGVIAVEYDSKTESWITPANFPQELQVKMQGYINTSEGKVIVSTGDYILIGPSGEVLTCKPEEFAENYEMAE